MERITDGHLDDGGFVGLGRRLVWWLVWFKGKEESADVVCGCCEMGHGRVAMLDKKLGVYKPFFDSAGAGVELVFE